MTPRLFANAVRGGRQARQHQHREYAWLAWHIEALARSKKLPTVRELTGEPEPPARPKSADELWAAMQQWAVAHNAAEARQTSR